MTVPACTVRRYKGFEIHPSPYNRGTCVEWRVRWHDKWDNAYSLAQPYSSIASAKRAINTQVRGGWGPERTKP